MREREGGGEGEMERGRDRRREGGGWRVEVGEAADLQMPLMTRPKA